jgi:hypothetical protein
METTIMNIIKNLFLPFLLLASCTVFCQTAELNKLDETTRVLSQPNGLYKAARLNGGVFVLRSDNHGFVVFDDLSRMAESSDAIIVASPLSRKVKLVNEGREVATLYELAVKEIVQGRRNLGRKVKLWIPGGSITFQDGTQVALYAPMYKELTIGGRYILYLQKVKVADAPPGTFFPTGGPQGIFEIDSNHKVVPHADPKVDIMAKHKQQDEQDFLTEARNKRDRAKD